MLKLLTSIFVAVVVVIAAPAVSGAQTTDAEKAVIAVADSALAAITRGDVVALTDLMIPEGIMIPTGTRDGVTSYRIRTRDAQRAAPMSGGVAMVLNRPGFRGDFLPEAMGACQRTQGSASVSRSIFRRRDASGRSAWWRRITRCL
jgi:hypothetical protein